MSARLVLAFLQTCLLLRQTALLNSIKMFSFQHHHFFLYNRDVADPLLTGLLMVKLRKRTMRRLTHTHLLLPSTCFTSNVSAVKDLIVLIFKVIFYSADQFQGVKFRVIKSALITKITQKLDAQLSHLTGCCLF